MNKTELIAAITDKTGLKKAEADKFYGAFVEVVLDAIKKDEKVQLIGFGTFEPKNKPAREGINPATKAKITIAASKSIGFKVSKAVKDTL